MNVFDLIPWGSSSSAGEVKPNPGSTIAATPSSGRVHRQQADQPGQPPPRQLRLGQVPGVQQQHGQRQVAAGPHDPGHDPVRQRAGQRPRRGQREHHDPGHREQQEHHPQAHPRGQPDRPGPVQPPRQQPPGHRDGETDPGEVGHAQRPPQRIPGQQRNDRPRRMPGQPASPGRSGRPFWRGSPQSWRPLAITPAGLSPGSARVMVSRSRWRGRAVGGSDGRAGVTRGRTRFGHAGAGGKGQVSVGPQGGGPGPGLLIGRPGGLGLGRVGGAAGRLGAGRVEAAPHRLGPG